MEIDEAEDFCVVMVGLRMFWKEKIESVGKVSRFKYGWG